jgi:hypothetical protein
MSPRRKEDATAIDRFLGITVHLALSKGRVFALRKEDAVPIDQYLRVNVLFALSRSRVSALRKEDAVTIDQSLRVTVPSRRRKLNPPPRRRTPQTTNLSTSPKPLPPPPIKDQTLRPHLSPLPLYPNPITPINLPNPLPLPQLNRTPDFQKRVLRLTDQTPTILPRILPVNFFPHHRQPLHVFGIAAVGSRDFVFAVAEPGAVGYGCEE